jgi:hypothetical protein
MKISTSKRKIPVCPTTFLVADVDKRKKKLMGNIYQSRKTVGRGTIKNKTD